MSKMKQYDKIFIHQNDLPNWVNFGSEVAVDTEAMGLSFVRDRLCLIQLTFDGKTCHLIQFNNQKYHESPNLVKLLEDEKVNKIFHFARFDVGLLFATFGAEVSNIYCTKIASKLARTYTDRHGLKSLCNELLNVEISKKEQSSDWGRENLTEEQKFYAANDVMHLIQLKEELNKILERENRIKLAYECFDALKCIVKLDCSGWSENLFAHL